MLILHSMQAMQGVKSVSAMPSRHPLCTDASFIKTNHLICCNFALALEAIISKKHSKKHPNEIKRLLRMIDLLTMIQIALDDGT